mmetsp:Transcript_25873/g.67892  ORF Transcript_25873/g.67892 Transcript_25873/m.67892 type:complete len:233 (-) Transcript_25873:293-991(-)
MLAAGAPPRLSPAINSLVSHVGSTVCTKRTEPSFETCPRLTHGVRRDCRCDSTRLQCAHRNSLRPRPLSENSCSRRSQKILLLILSESSTRFRSSSKVSRAASRESNLLVTHEILDGDETTAFRCLRQNARHSLTSASIFKKSDETRMETTFLIVRAARSTCAAPGFSVYATFALTYFISQSKILTSQWTEISIPSSLATFDRQPAKYFISRIKTSRGQRKSLRTLRDSSRT